MLFGTLYISMILSTAKRKENCLLGIQCGAVVIK